MNLPHRSAIKLTNQSLQQLKESGFRFVLIKGYTTDSEILIQWASFPDDGAKVIIEMESLNIAPCP